MDFNKLLKNKLCEIKTFLDEENKLIKNLIIDEAYKINNELIKKLLEEEKLKETFFQKIKDVYVFNVNKFIDYVKDKDFLDNSYTKFKNKIGLSSSNKFIYENNQVVINFPFKDCILEGGQNKEEKKTRKEIFFNEILAKDEIDRLLDGKVLTNFKRINKSGEKKLEEIKKI